MFFHLSIFPDTLKHIMCTLLCTVAQPENNYLNIFFFKSVIFKVCLELLLCKKTSWVVKVLLVF